MYAWTWPVNLTNSQAFSLNGIWVQAVETEIWAYKRLKFSIFDCFSCGGTFTMRSTRRVHFELALAGGREVILKGGPQLIPGYWAGFLGWDCAPLLFQVWRWGVWGHEGSRRIWGLFLSPLWGEFSQFKGTVSGNLCPLKWDFFGGEMARQYRPLRIRPTGIIRISSQCPRRGS